MRKGFDGLCSLVRSGMKRDPLLGDVFVFINHRRTHITFPVWDRSGWVLYNKRLESRTFELPETATPLWAELMMLLDRVRPATVRYRPRFRGSDS